MPAGIDDGDRLVGPPGALQARDVGAVDPRVPGEDPAFPPGAEHESGGHGGDARQTRRSTVIIISAFRARSSGRARLKFENQPTNSSPPASSTIARSSWGKTMRVR